MDGDVWGNERAERPQEISRNIAVGRLTGEDFASRLDRAVDASNRAKLIEGRVIEGDD